MPLESKLQAGDSVEVLTSRSESAGPSKDWLNFVGLPWSAEPKSNTGSLKSARRSPPRTARKRWLEGSEEKGSLSSPLMSSDSLTKLAEEHGLVGIPALFNAIGQGQLTVGHCH